MTEQGRESFELDCECDFAAPTERHAISHMLKEHAVTAGTLLKRTGLTLAPAPVSSEDVSEMAELPRWVVDGSKKYLVRFGLPCYSCGFAPHVQGTQILASVCSSGPRRGESTTR